VVATRLRWIYAVVAAIWAASCGRAESHVAVEVREEDGSDYVLVRWSDELGVQSVRLHPLLKTDQSPS
jgi:hypothetical protein